MLISARHLPVAINAFPSSPNEILSSRTYPPPFQVHLNIMSSVNESKTTLVDPDSQVYISKPPAQYDRVAKCSEGHLFTTIWVPMISLKALRFGKRRYQHCPVGNHWCLIEPVDETQLSAHELNNAREHRDTRVL